MKAAVLGSPIAHSLSPTLHRAAYAALGLDGWSYQAIECDAAGLPARVACCGTGWAGLSLTMPLKRAVLPLLDEADPVVAETGSANTVVFAGGRRRGHNTDVPGMVAALTAAACPTPPSATILGAGATACSALAALRDIGLRQVTVAIRDRARADDLLTAAGRLGVSVTVRPFERADRRGEEGADRVGDLLVSTVPAGAADGYAEGIRAGRYTPSVVFDVVYDPWPTQLAEAARQRGAVVIGGFELLLHQAARQVELMTGHRPAPVAAMRAAGLAELDRRAEWRGQQKRC